MSGPRTWQAETERMAGVELVRLARKARRKRATWRDAVVALWMAAICGGIALIALWAMMLTAKADQISIGVWDNANPSAGVQMLAQFSSPTFTMTSQITPTVGTVISTAIFTDAANSTFREAAFNDLHFAGPGTIRLYVDFQGVTSTSLQNTFPTTFQASELVLPGYVVADQIFLCGNTLFCDDFVVGGGTLLGMTTWSGAVGTVFPTFTATVPSNPFSINEVFTIAYNGTGPVGDIAGAILTQPDVAVPGPIAGAGLPGIIAACFALLGLARRRKQ